MYRAFGKSVKNQAILANFCEIPNALASWEFQLQAHGIDFVRHRSVVPSCAFAFLPSDMKHCSPPSTSGWSSLLKHIEMPPTKVRTIHGHCHTPITMQLSFPSETESDMIERKQQRKHFAIVMSRYRAQRSDIERHKVATCAHVEASRTQAVTEKDTKQSSRTYELSHHANAHH